MPARFRTPSEPLWRLHSVLQSTSYRSRCVRYSTQLSWTRHHMSLACPSSQIDVVTHGHTMHYACINFPACRLETAKTDRKRGIWHGNSFRFRPAVAQDVSCDFKYGWVVNCHKLGDPANNRNQYVIIYDNCARHRNDLAWFQRRVILTQLLDLGIIFLTTCKVRPCNSLTQVSLNLAQV